MNRVVRFQAVLIALFLLTATATLAQSSGEAVYKAKCLNCHGPTGLANSGIGKLMHVKPITDPDVKKMSLTEMIEATRKGMGKMQAYQGNLSEAEIKSSVEYFRSFLK